jgi:hypothetical protein
MKNRLIFKILLLIILFSPCAISAEPQSSMVISGEVKQSLTLSINDLNKFQTVNVQLNEVMKDKTYRGAFFYHGVTLRTLLDMASIEKKVKSSSKDIGLAIRIRNREGKEVILSWGEIYYRNSGNIIIATSATPIMPRHGCESCHKTEFTKPYMDQLSRDIGFPKLVVGSDGYADRSIDGVVSIEVIDPAVNQDVKKASSSKLYSSSFKITGLVKQEMSLTELSKYPGVKKRIIHFGEGKGFHGIYNYSGASFKDLLNQAGINEDLTSIFIVSAPDGYYSLFSYGELFLSRVEEPIIIADKENDKPIDEGGKFFLIPTEDLMSDRDVKSVEKIEVLKLK